MEKNMNKPLIISLSFLVCFLLIIQIGNSRVLFDRQKTLKENIEKQQQKNILLKNKYSLNETFSQAASREKIVNLKEITTQILAELKLYHLILIDFSSTKNELNLNLTGDFNSFLKFLYYIENELKVLKIEEFKIKDNSKSLFFFLKLKKELI
ncbi:hypothetical protein [Halanaerobium kushneri]|nr:hypothetical protein [Halanaerobium kushneri]